MRLILHQKSRNLLCLVLISRTDHSSPFAVTHHACVIEAEFVEGWL